MMTRLTLLLGVAVLLTTTGTVQARHYRPGGSIRVGGVGGYGYGYSRPYYSGYPYYGRSYVGGYPYYAGYYPHYAGYYPYSSGVTLGVGVVPRPVPVYVPRTTYVYPSVATPTTYVSPTRDASPTAYESPSYVPAPKNAPGTVKPAKKATIKILNPATNAETLGYTLDGKHVFHLKPGESQELDRESEIAFDRSGVAGVARYTLSSGTYKFSPKEDGSWELLNADASPR